MNQGYTGQPYDLIVDTPNTLTGLTDVTFAVFTIAGAPVPGSPFAASEIGTTGVYTATWPSPPAAGSYLVEVSAPSVGAANVSDTVRILDNSNDDLDATIAGLENLSAADVWAAASRTLTDRTNFELEPGQFAQIANAVQAAIIDEGDGQQVIDAIVQAINAADIDIDEAIVSAAVVSDLERSGGLLEEVRDAVLAQNLPFKILG